MGHTFEERMAGAVHVAAQEKTPLRPNELVSLDGKAGQAYRVQVFNNHAKQIGRVNVFGFVPHPPVQVFLCSLVIPLTTQDVIFKMPETGSVIVKNTSQAPAPDTPELSVQFTAI